MCESVEPRTRKLFVSKLLAVTALCFVSSTAALAGSTTEEIICQGCTTYAQLQSQASTSGRSIGIERSGGPSDDTFYLYVVSDVAMISSAFQITQKWHHSAQDQPRATIVVPLITNEEQAIAFDNAVFAKALAPISVPSSVAGAANSALYEDVNSWIRSTFPFFVSVIPSGWKVYDSRIPAYVFLKPGDTVTVQFADGSSARMIFNGSGGSTISWLLVPGSERQANGRPYGDNTPRTYTRPRQSFWWNGHWVSFRPDHGRCGVETTTYYGLAVVVRADDC